MTKHTPAPWKAEFDEAVSVRSEDGSRICTINWLRGRHGLKGRIDGDEGNANARLIAAAPDLLETLKQIKRENQHYNFGSKLVRIVDAAIAKAEGEP